MCLVLDAVSFYDSAHPMKDFPDSDRKLMEPLGITLSLDISQMKGRNENMINWSDMILLSQIITHSRLN